MAESDAACFSNMLISASLGESSIQCSSGIAHTEEAMSKKGSFQNAGGITTYHTH
jgi:hypothetical protein